MKHPFRGEQFKTILSCFLLAVAIIIAYKFIMGIDTFFANVRWFFNMISPFLYGFLLAYVLNIPCSGLRRLLNKSQWSILRRKEKALSVIAVYLIAGFIMFLVVRIVSPAVYQSVFLFSANFDSYYHSAQTFVDYINNMDVLSIDISIDNLLNTARDFALQKLPSSLNMLVSISSGLFIAFLALLSSVYILWEKNRFQAYLNKLFQVFLPANFNAAVLRYAEKLNTNFKQYIYTQTIDGLILGTIATIELFILQSPYALVLGIMLGIVNYIPYFGSIFGSIFVVLVVAFTQGITTAVITAAVLLITQQIDANVIQPRLMSNSFSLSPLLVIISITVGGRIFGVIGMIAAIPIVAVIKDILDELTAYQENKNMRRDEHG